MGEVTHSNINIYDNNENNDFIDYCNEIEKKIKRKNFKY
jgi:hypothetical protein